MSVNYERELFRECGYYLEDELKFAQEFFSVIHFNNRSLYSNFIYNNHLSN